MLLLQATRRALPSLHVLAENGMRALGLPQSRDMSNVAVHGLKAGPGGRSSVSGIVATVFGANGFIGSYITNEIAKTGSQVVCPFRSVENDVMHLKQMGDLGQIVLLPEFSIRDDDAIRHAISRSNVVVNLVGQRTETMNFSYEDAHVDFPRRLAKICAESGHIERLIQFSEIGASETSKSHRLRTKALGDKAVSEAFPDATIVRPGPVVGIEDYFYNYIIYQLQFSVIAPIIDNGANKMAPTYVLDVAAAAAKIISRPDTAGKTFYLAGPETLTMREIYDVIIKTLRLRQDDSVHVPAWLLKQLWRFKDSSRRYLPSLPVASYMASVDYVEEQLVDALPPPGALGYADLDHRPVKVTDGLAIEPVRHFRVGGYQWGDMARVASNVPENIKKYYNIKA